MISKHTQPHTCVVSTASVLTQFQHRVNVLCMVAHAVHYASTSKQTSLNNKVTARRRLAASEAVWGARMVIAWTERDMNRPLWKKKYFATCSLSHDKLP